MKRLLTLALATTFIFSSHLVYAQANNLKPNGPCSKSGQVMKLNGKTYKCKQTNSKLVWKLNKKKSNSASASSSIATKFKVNDTDTQLFYSTSGCKNEIGYLRFNEQNLMVSKKIVVKTSNNIQLIPENYENGKLLFTSFDCDFQNTSLYSLNINKKSALPVELLRNSKENQIINAQWDLATGLAIALVSINNQEHVVITADSQKRVLWSSALQGWGLSGGITKVFPHMLLAHTGREFVIFGNQYPGWTSVKVNFGRSQVGTETQFRGIGTLVDVSKSILDGPYAVGLNTGTFLCSISPFLGTGRTSENLESNKDCMKVSDSSPIGPSRLAFGFTKSSSSDSRSQILIDIQSRTGHTFTPTGPFDSGPTLDVKSRSLSNVIGMRVISAFELSFNIGETAPSIILNG